MEILPIESFKFTFSKFAPQAKEHGLHGLETILKGGLVNKKGFCGVKEDLRIFFQILTNHFPKPLWEENPRQKVNVPGSANSPIILFFINFLSTSIHSIQI